MHLDDIFNDRILLVEFVEAINRQLDEISDNQIQQMRDLLKYWNPEEDFEKMDKLTILYRHAQLP